MKLPISKIVIVLCLSGFTTLPIPAQTPTDVRPLSVAQPIERELKGGEAHSYIIMVKAGQYLHIIVDQRGIDVAAALFGADGKKLAEVDSQNGRQGPEPVVRIVETTGTYRLEVRSPGKTAAAGRYEIRIKEQRTANENDRTRFAAQKMIAEGRVLRSRTGEESLRGAINKFEEALPLYRMTGDKSDEASTLNSIGAIYSDLREKQTAIEYYSKALSLYRALGDKRGEAISLANIALVYKDLKESQKALEYYLAALQLTRAIGEKRGEAISLSNIGLTYKDLDDKQKALEYFLEALPLRRSIGDKPGEANMLTNIGAVYNALGDKQKALEYYLQAAPLRHELGDKSSEGTVLNSIGLIYKVTGEKQKAIENFLLALELRRSTGDKRGECSTLNNIGLVYHTLDEEQTALEYFLKALERSRDAADLRGQGDTLDNIGSVYGALDETQKAFEYFFQALSLRQAIGNKEGEGTTLNNIGLIYHAIGEEQTALEYFSKALLLHRAITNRSGEAVTLNNIGAVYLSLEEKQEAQKYYFQSLLLRRAMGDKHGEATMYNNIGALFNHLRLRQTAIEYYSKALLLFRAIGEKHGEALTLSNIGFVYKDEGNNQKALEYYLQAILIIRAIGDRRDEATMLNNIGLVYEITGEKQKAIENYLQAWPLHSTVMNRRGEALMLDNLSVLWKNSGNLRLATVYGKLALSNYQGLRGSINKLDKDVQQSFLKSIAKTYRRLADTLLAQKRFSEAQQVLTLFKDQQYLDFNSNIQAAPLALTIRERELADTFNKKLERITAVIRRLDSYKRGIGRREPDKSEAEQIQIYEADLKAANDDYSAFFKLAEAEFSGPLSDRDKVGEIADTQEMQTTLRNLQSQTGQKAVAIYTLESEENYRALLITVDKTVAVSYPIKATELSQKAVDLFGQLSEVDKHRGGPKSSTSEVQKTGKELYDIIFAPVAVKLKELGIKPDVLMWSLDGALRYIPVAALYDGKRYLVKSYRNVVFTRANSERMLAQISLRWTGSGFYNSKEHTVSVNGQMKRFAGLENAKTELESIFGVPPVAGNIKGTFSANEQFTKESLFSSLKLKRPLVHIASHFQFEPGDAGSSFLLLGDGTKLTMEDLKNAPDDLFEGVELLTLSACETGLQKERESDGREIDGFAELAQRKGAKAVLASLWNVDDRSTSQLFTQFYLIRETEKNSKAEALQEIQLLLIKSKNFSHPYYWAPFFLTGNWQ